MLITQGFGFIAPFNAWLFLIPLVIIVIGFALMSYEGNLRKKMGKPLKADQLGITGGVAMVCIVALVPILMFFFALGSGTHVGTIEKDFEEQFSITHADYTYIDDKKAITGKDSEGRYVICNWSDTKSSDTFAVTCDNGKDNWKGPQ